jgi:hypothetical protein
VDQVNSAISSNLAIVAGALAVVAVLVLVLVAALLVQSRRLARLTIRVDGLTRGVDGRSLESVLDSHLETVFRVARDLDTLDARAGAIETAARRHFDRVGLVRFNPFEDTGGNQSFALVLLDGNSDGFVISSLHSRTGTRMYAKAVKGGTSEAALSAEETQALEVARSQAAPRSYSRPPAGSRTGDSARTPSSNVRGVSPSPLTPVVPTEVGRNAESIAPSTAEDGDIPNRPSWKDAPRS